MDCAGRREQYKLGFEIPCKKEKSTNGGTIKNHKKTHHKISPWTSSSYKGKLGAGGVTATYTAPPSTTCGVVNNNDGKKLVVPTVILPSRGKNKIRPFLTRLKT